MRACGLRAFVLAGVMSLALPAGAHAVDADPVTAAALQVQLVQGRQRVDALYAQAAVASEQLNGANYRLALATAAARRNAKALAAAERDLHGQRQAVAELTVQDLQSGNQLTRLGSLFGAAGPGQLLDRSAAYASTQEAMAARIDTLTASSVVHAAAARHLSAALAQQRAARSAATAARAAIEEAMADAEAAVRQMRADRAVLLEKLATAQDVPLAAVRERQADIDRKLDATPVAPPAPSVPPVKDQRDDAEPPPAPPVVSRPPATSNRVETAIAFAMAQLGDPYQWGASGPDSWDCSGLVMRAWAAAGVSLPHFGGAQYEQTTPVRVSDIRRGDLLFWSNGSAASIYHVAIYLGDGQMIQAPRTGRNVEIVPLTYWIRPDLASRPG